MSTNAIPRGNSLHDLARAALGAVALYYGTRRRGLIGWALAAGGGRLLSQGLAGVLPGSALHGAADAWQEGLRRGALNERAAARLRV